MHQRFLQDSFEGVDHPSRSWVRGWLRDHPGLRLLDIPCGPGVEYEGFERDDIPVEYLGMDHSDTMLEAFRRRFPNASLQKGSIHRIPLSTGSMDVVLCRHILEHLEDFRPAVGEAVRVTQRWLIIVLFRQPTRGEHRTIGWGAYDNRIDHDALTMFLDELAVRHTWHRIDHSSAPQPMPPSRDPDTIIVVEKPAGESQGIGGRQGPAS